MDQNNKFTSEQVSKEAFLQRAHALYKQGNFTECAKECDKAIIHGWGDGDIYNIKAIALAQLQQ